MYLLHGASAGAGPAGGPGSLRDRAIGILEKMLEEDSYYAPVLVHYVRVAVDCGQARNAIPHLLRYRTARN